ncbi:acyl-CoA N-acyltransferases (NAT) superfamily protein isoform X3 [Tasmannia lanceolata]|uniref:acyl-CoA N-acyltransferases (NAT) superfamily protein isoform X3 n=1 Tax=Tasmannia lanceolata TaxID=3420 RepID=UPI004063BEFD
MAISIHSLHFSATSKPKPYERKNPPPIFISTNPSHLNLLQLRDLFNSTNLSCHRFPQFNSDGRVKPVDLDKLQIALAHSSVIVSVFCRTKFSSREENDEKLELGFGELFQRAIPVSESNGQLVGFGRAVSDNGLTASIYDVAVLPSLQRLGIGHKIVKRIIRVLTGRGIYDIAALCSEKESMEKQILAIYVCGSPNQQFQKLCAYHCMVGMGNNKP